MNFDQLFHVGIRVPDLGRAMSDMGVATGVRWSTVQHRQQAVWLPATGASTVDLHFTYSMEGPVHLELLQGEPGSIWDGDDAPGPHHLGVWVDDVAATTESLISAGWSLELASRSPDDGYGAFTYVRSPTGIIVEPVSLALKPTFERWWAGGDL